MVAFDHEWKYYNLQISEAKQLPMYQRYDFKISIQIIKKLDEQKKSNENNFCSLTIFKQYLCLSLILTCILVFFHEKLVILGFQSEFSSGSLISFIFVKLDTSIWENINVFYFKKNPNFSAWLIYL